MSLAGVAIFVLTYLLIAARRLSWLGLDRPAGALLGAVACVLFGVLSPAEAFAAVDGATLLLLLGVMGMGAFLQVDGFFDRLGDAALRLAGTRARLLALVVWGSGFLAALITNDAVCVLGTPLLVRLIRRCHLPPLPFLLALATAANTGSAATLVGNPQNMLCGLLGGLAYRDHLALAGPVALLGLAIDHLVLWLAYRRALGDEPLPRTLDGAHRTDAPDGRRSAITLLVIAGTAVAYTAGTDLAWTAASGLVLLMLVHRRDTRRLWPHIDWSLLLFFAGLFVVVKGLMQSGAPAAVFERFPLTEHAGDLWGWSRLAGVFVAGSNLVSNVPFILVVREQIGALPDPTLGWELLAVASTFAGNLTLLGSAANVIVAEASHEVGGIGFFQHLRVGFPIAVLTTAVGVLWLVVVGG